MEEKTTNPLAIVSLVAGILAILGHGCCCIPFVGAIFGILVLILEVVAIVTGFIARSKAEEGQSEPLAMAGIAAGIVAVLMSIAYFALFFGTMALSMVMN